MDKFERELRMAARAGDLALVRALTRRARREALYWQAVDAFPFWDGFLGLHPSLKPIATALAARLDYRYAQLRPFLDGDKFALEFGGDEDVIDGSSMFRLYVEVANVLTGAAVANGQYQATPPGPTATNVRALRAWIQATSARAEELIASGASRQIGAAQALFKAVGRAELFLEQKGYACDASP